MKQAWFVALALAIGSPAISAPIDVFFRGNLEFDETGSVNTDNTVSEVDAAVRSLLAGTTITGNFTIDLNTPLEAGSSTDPGETAVYKDASTGLEISINGSSFSDEDPNSCLMATASVICDARQTNDQVFSSILEPFDSLSIVSDLAPSDDFTRAIETESGVSATVVRPTFSFFAPVVGSVSFFANDFGLFPTTDLGNPLDVTEDQRGMQFTLTVSNNFVIDEDARPLPRYQFTINDLEISDTAFADPVAVVPLPAGAFLVLTGILAFAGLKRRDQTAQWPL